jgi:hypothetical protein
VEAPPFAEGKPFGERELFAREAVHIWREREEEGDHSRGGSLYSRKQPQVEEDVEALPRHPLEVKEDTIGRVTMIKGAMPSTLMGVMFLFVHGL